MCIRDSGTVLATGFGAGFTDGGAATSLIVSVNAGCPTGCTDPAATNYDASALIDDGSCVIPNQGCTDPNATNYDSTAINDDGSCTYNAANYLTFTWTETASYGGEISWEVQSVADGTVELSGVDADQGPLFVNTGCYNMVGFDSAGDGWTVWNGNWSMDVTDADSNVLITGFGFDFDSGLGASYTFASVLDVNSGCTLSLIHI